MKYSRRGRILPLVNEDRSDTEILSILDKEFPPGRFSKSNRQALAGAKWELRSKAAPSPRKRLPSQKRIGPSVFPTRNELVSQLRAFPEGPTIDDYKKKRPSCQSPRELLASISGPSIWRAFQHESPSLRYKRWRWVDAAKLLFQKLNAIRSQEQFDRLAFEVGESLVVDWGAAKNNGEPSVMNIGIAMKITNLAFKHATFSDLIHNPRLKGWLHVPWDKFTLAPLCQIWQRRPAIQSTQGFVKNLDTYLELHSLITPIVADEGVSVPPAIRSAPCSLRSMSTRRSWAISPSASTL